MAKQKTIDTQSFYDKMAPFYNRHIEQTRFPMNHAVVPYLASPKKKSELHLTKKRQANGRIVSGQLVSKDGAEAFKVVAGIPLLQPKGDPAEWGHPIREILFGDRAFGIEKHFYELDPDHCQALCRT